MNVISSYYISSITGSVLILVPLVLDDNFTLWARFDILQYNILQYNTILYNTTQCNSILYDAIQYNTTQ